MRIRLNLLPEKRKKEIRKKTILRFIIWQEVIIILIVILFLIMIYGVNSIIRFRLDEVNKDLAMQTSSDGYRKIEHYEQVFRDIGGKVYLLQKIQKNDADWVNIFLKINDAIPNGITINFLRSEGYKITLKGVAITRADLIDLKNNFDKEKCFSNVSIPLSDIVLKNNIDFQLEFNVNKNCLTSYGD